MVKQNLKNVTTKPDGPDLCPNCNGTGEISRGKRAKKTVTCTLCNGSGIFIPEEFTKKT